MATATAAFVFPPAAGHTNPALPLCHRLVALGWRVEFLSVSDFKSAIEDTGATYHDRDAVFAEHGGIMDLMAAARGIFAEYGDPSSSTWALNFGSITTERFLPVYIKFLQRLSPQLVVYCPVLSHAAHLAAMHLGIPTVSLLTTAGPGFYDVAFASHGGSAAGLVATIKANKANAKALDAVRLLLKMPELTLNTAEPLIHEHYAGVNLVTTVRSMADMLGEEDSQFYESAGKAFEFVGPLLGAKQVTMAGALSESEAADMFKRVGEAVAAGREVVYVSMGTVVTGDDEKYGWRAKGQSALTGEQLCHAVYRAAFEELGDAAAAGAAGTAPLLSPPPLVVLSTGPQPDALAGVPVPANAICLKSVPQVELLRMAKPALVVTNGGQNSFIESVSVGSPLVVCPGFGDQVTNAARAQTLGVGVKVDRPAQVEGGTSSDQEVAAAYQAAVSQAIQEVLGASRHAFVAKAQAVAAELKEAGGVDRAVQLLAKAAGVAGPASSY